MSESKVSNSSMNEDIMEESTHGIGLKVLLGVVCFFSVISLTIAMPILPVFAKYFHINKDTAQQIASIVFLGSAISGLIYGPLSDSFGRKRVLVFVLSMYGLFAFLSSLAKTIELFMFLQFFQGLHAGSATVLGLAIAKDAFKGASAAKAVASLGLIVPIAPATAPLIGGYLQTYYGWQAIYIFLAIMGAIIMSLAFFFLPETHKVEDRLPFSFRVMRVTFLEVLKKKEFLIYAVMLSLTHSCIMMYNVTASFMFSQQFGVKLENFGYYQMLSTSGVIVGNFIVNKFVMEYGLTKLLRFGSLMAVTAVFLFFFVMIQGIQIPVFFSLCMFIFCIGLGCIFSTAMPLSMSTVPSAKGYTSSLMRLTQLLGSSISTAVIAEFYNQTFWPMFAALAVFGFSIFFLGHFGTKRQDN